MHTILMFSKPGHALADKNSFPREDLFEAIVRMVDEKIAKVER